MTGLPQRVLAPGQPGCTPPLHFASRRYALRYQRITAVYATSIATQPVQVQQEQLQVLTRELGQQRVEPKRLQTDMGERVGVVSSSVLPAGREVLCVPESLAVTTIDAEKSDVVGEVATTCSELISLTLWLMSERAKGRSSPYYTFLSTLPARVDTCPLVWSDAELAKELQGSPVLAEARSRMQELRTQWASLTSQHLQDTARFDPAVFNEDNFRACFSVVVAHATYLPAAGCFALVPIVANMGRTGNPAVGAAVDYDAARQAVVVTAAAQSKAGEEVRIMDGRPNGELFLSTGSLEPANSSDFVLFDASLVRADKYYTMKAQILETLGFGPREQFPVYADRMPNQLFAYLRLSRVADPALFAKVSFEKDVVLSQMNEYEILQILMGDCRERLAAYPFSYEEEIKLLQGRELSVRQRASAKLRISEIRLLNSTMDAVRQRLAPIRGIPTKSGGMVDPNSDLKEIFDIVESLPAAPVKLFQGFVSWARGDDDPDWGKKSKKK